MIILTSAFLLKITSLGKKNANAITLFPFIIVKNTSIKINKNIIRHEFIHIYQQIELLIIPFYFIYIVHFFINKAKGMSNNDAYLSICFEKEAYKNDADEQYIKKRKLWNWITYF